MKSGRRCFSREHRGRTRSETTHPAIARRLRQQVAVDAQRNVWSASARMPIILRHKLAADDRAASGEMALRTELERMEMQLEQRVGIRVPYQKTRGWLPGRTQSGNRLARSRSPIGTATTRNASAPTVRNSAVTYTGGPALCNMVLTFLCLQPCHLPTTGTTTRRRNQVQRRVGGCCRLMELVTTDWMRSTC